MNIKTICICVLLVFVICGCETKDIQLFMQQNNTPVFVCLYYDEKVLVFDEQDYTNGKYLLDYNSNIGKQFAAKNKIEFDEYDIDYKQKINHLREKIVLPETTSAEKVRKFGEPNPDKTEKKIKSDRNPDAKEGTEADKSETKQSEDNAKAQKPDEVENEDEDTVSDISEPAISPDKAISETSGKKNVLTKKKDKKKKPDEKSKNKKEIKDGDKKEQEKEKKQKPNAKLHFENIKDDEMTVDETMDSLIKIDFIYEPIKISEFNLYNRQAGSLLMEQMRQTFGYYNIDMTDDLNAAADCQTRLLLKVIKYRPGEYNMIKDIPTKITIACAIQNERYGVSDQFVRTYVCFANENYPSEANRMKEIISNVVNDLKLYLSKVVLKTADDVPFQEATDDKSEKM